MTTALALDPDAVLMLKAAGGDGPSFELLVQRHRMPVVNHLHHLVHNWAIAEELAQDVFVRVYRSREKYQPDAKFRTWLFRITTNLALNWKRDTRREISHLRLDEESPNVRKLEITDDAPRVDQLLLDEYRAKEVRAAIQSLPSKQLPAVVMHKYEGMDYEQIAEVLDCSIPALKSLLFRAYETLRKRLCHFSTPALVTTAK